MGRTLLSRLGLLAIFAIVVLLILENLTTIMAGELGFRVYAGILSIIIGAFAFSKMFMFSKKKKIGHVFFQIIMVLLGAALAIDQAHNLLLELNAFMNIIIICFYILTLLLFAYFTTNEIVGRGEIREAELLMDRQEKFYAGNKRKTNRRNRV